jgi:hypothetical protein
LNELAGSLYAKPLALGKIFKCWDVFNNKRPHEELDMKCPAGLPAFHPYSGLPDIDYPLHDKAIVVTRCGRICLGKKKVNFSQIFALCNPCLRAGPKRTGAEGGT